MTRFDRIEEHMPDLLVGLATPRVPDYFDDMLQQTGRTRQRPAWRDAERWLPMGISARTGLVRVPSWRPLALLAILIVIVVASAVLIAGSRPRVPSPFGPAANGVFLVSLKGDIVALDPVTSKTTPVIVGATNDIGPNFARDGRTFVFDRFVSDTESSLAIANADGTGLRELLPPGAPYVSADWSPASDRLLLVRLLGRGTETLIVDVGTGATTQVQVDPALGINDARWRPGHDQLVLGNVGPNGSESKFYLAKLDGKVVHPIATRTAVNEAAISPDGSKLAITSLFHVHLVDIDSGEDLDLKPGAPIKDWEFAPQFSPDGRQLLFFRFGGDTQQLILAPADGHGPEVPLGPVVPSTGGWINAMFAPDGTQILANYETDHTNRLLDVHGGPGTTITVDALGSWQRLAP